MHTFVRSPRRPPKKPPRMLICVACGCAVQVVGAEWYWVLGRNASNGDNGNNGVVSLQGPQYDLAMVEHHRDIRISDINIDAQGVGRLLAIGLKGVAPMSAGCSSVDGLVLANVTFAHPLNWFATNLSLSSSPIVGENLLCAEGCDTIRNVALHNVTIGGKRVATSADWYLDTVGNVTNVTYG